MKAAQIKEYGGPAVLKISDVPKPTIQPDQVLVEVVAAAANPFDISVREGHARQMKELDFPATLGGDAAGTITEVGAEVEGFEVGQAVYGQANALSGQGSFAEFTPIVAKQVAGKPTKLDFVQAASLPLAASSAYQAIVDHINLQPGQKILIHGGGGGIGSIAVQLAKYLDAYVATTVGPDDLAFVKELGADEVINYKDQDFTKIINNYDAVFDTVGGETTTKSYAVLKNGGALVAMASQPDEELVKQHNINFTAQFTRTTTDSLTKIAELVDQGHIKPQVAKIFPLEQAAEALDYLATKHPRGKIVIQIK